MTWSMRARSLLAVTSAALVAVVGGACSRSELDFEFLVDLRGPDSGLLDDAGPDAAIGLKIGSNLST